MTDIWFAAPGKLDQPTGGFVYDRRILEYCRAQEMTVHYRELHKSFPEPSASAIGDAQAFLDALPANAVAVIDGLAFGAMPEMARAAAERVRLVALIHHPLGDETGHSSEKRDRLLHREVLALEAASLIIVTSHFTRLRLIELGVPDAKIKVIEPGVDPHPVAHGSRSEIPNLLCVASYTRRKGHLVLFDALEQCLDLDWQLIAIGAEGLDPEHETEVKKRAAWFEDRVEVRGPAPREVIDELLGATDIFVLPSLYEGYGMVLSEALAAGLPIVSTTGGAIPFTVPEAASLLVAPGNAAALKDALRQILSNPELREELRRGALDVRADQASWETAGSRFRAAIDDLSR